MSAPIETPSDKRTVPVGIAAWCVGWRQDWRNRVCYQLGDDLWAIYDNGQFMASGTVDELRDEWMDAR